MSQLRESDATTRVTAHMGTNGAAHTVAGTDVPLGYQQITVLTASTALTPPAGARVAHIQGQGQVLRWRDDGVAPTAAVGMNLAVGATIAYSGSLSAIRLIETAVGGIANVTYYR